MKVEVVYVYPTVAGNGYDHYAERFVESYLKNPPSVEHTTTVVCNGNPASLEMKGLFSLMQSTKFLVHDNSGYDIGAYQAASRESAADMIVFFGASAYIRKPGWLLRMVRAFDTHGEAQYGCMGNRGDAGVRPHLRTTGIWCSPKLFNSYPHQITKPEQRHPFEHGPQCFTTFVTNRGLKNWVVTASGDWLWASWDDIPNGFHRGDQSDLLTGDHLSEPPYYHTA